MESESSLSGFPFKHKRFSKRLKSITVTKNVAQTVLSPPFNPSIYRCPLCQKIIACISTFILHVAGHSSCDMNEAFQQSELLQKTKTNSDDDFMFILVPKPPHLSCDICSKGFTNKHLLAAHIKRHLSTQRFICEACGSTFKQKSGLKEHFASVHSPDRCATCDICQKTFKSLRTLREHLEIYHLKNCQFQCEKCDRKFGRKSDLKIHERQHDTFKEFSCSICGHQFTHRKRLKEHEKIHLSQKQHQCQICLKSFAQLAGLNQHLKVHSIQPQFECEVCNQQFKHSSTYYSHRKEHLGVKKENICSECGKRCPSRFSLYHHRRTHLNLTYACSLCQKKFKWKESLRLHIAKHSNKISNPIKHQVKEQILTMT